MNRSSITLKAVLLTVLLLVGLILMFAVTNVQEIIKNWSRYRCNPAFMPFASAAGYDTTENFQFCLNSIFGEKAKEVFAPIFALLANFTQIIKLIVDVSLGLRKMFSNFFLGMNRFVRNVRDRIQALMFQIRMSFMKMQNLMGRVYATMFSVIFMGMSAITAGMNISENSLVEFILEFCFHPDTLVTMQDGTTKRIEDIQIGDILASNVRVTSTFQFSGEGTPMVQIGEDRLSSQHLVQLPQSGAWNLAEHHPDAVPIPSIPRLICLNVEGHEFLTATGLRVRDYDETEAFAVISAAQKMAETALNGGVSQSNSSAPVNDYSLGLDADAELQLEDHAWKRLDQIQLGDRLLGSNEVVGLVKEVCQRSCRLESSGLRVSEAQLVHQGESWIRAGSRYSVEETDTVLLQLMTKEMRPLCIRRAGCDSVVWVRDYREAPLPSMEEPYRNEVLSSQ